jgi:hypothetical protein
MAVNASLLTTAHPSFLAGSNLGTPVFRYLTASPRSVNFAPSGAKYSPVERTCHPQRRNTFVRGRPFFFVAGTGDETRLMT